MKKVYCVDCCSEFGSGIEMNINELGHSGVFHSRKEAFEEMVECVKDVKETFADEIKEEKENGNTISVDLIVAYVDDDFDEEYDTIWTWEHYVVASRYICGRW